MGPAPDQQRYRSVIGHFATGVAVITGRGPDGPVGMTANALCSLSLDPPLVLVCFDNASRTFPIVRRAGRFAINLLSHDQDELSGVFASKMGELEKFSHIPHQLVEGVPIIDGALAWLTCDLNALYPGGDHTIGVGAVIEMGEHSKREPLVWYRGRYTRLARGGTGGELAPPGADLV
ncbi:MAG: flavin reductase family protein [Actinobacteria bacterium]|nr:MAG: flavin reductase family protein [Actinomycetota bacterium]